MFTFNKSRYVNTLYLITSIIAKNILLVPKENHLKSFGFNVFVLEHNLEHIVSIQGLNVYKTNDENFKLFKMTFEHLFDIEDDLIFTQPQPQSQEQDKDESTPWHLDRITKRHLPLDGKFEYYESGTCHKNKDLNIHTYIVDTGIDIKHVEFEGRAIWLENFSGDNQDNDCNSHGTHCAGLVGSKNYGICKDANLFAVKVLNCEGSGSYSGILSGLDFVYKRHIEELSKNSGVRSIVSMSLGGGFSKSINRAVESLVTLDTIYVVVASGNEDSDACSTSPASARGVFTVNAMDRYDNRAYFSNFGKCTDIYSPGVDILSTTPGGNTAVYSGTSMATPILVGVLNHYIDQFPHMNMKQIKEKMINDSTKEIIKGNPLETNNLLVFLNREEM